MNWILKNKNKPVLTVLLSSLARKWKRIFISLVSFDNKNAKALVVALFLMSIFLFLPSQNVKAANGDPACSFTAKVDGIDTPNKRISIGTMVDGVAVTFTNCCEKAKLGIPGFIGQCVPLETDPASVAGSTPPATEEVKAKESVLAAPFTNAFKMLLIGVLSIVGWLWAVAATLFAWAVDPVNVSGTNGILNKQAVKDVWVMVRDLLNMTFILILLFAAFCTIFQVEKWNLKKVWLGILINALLVNFSFPIARFFIDVSNVAFYYFVNNLFSSTTTVTGSGIFAMFGASSGMSELLVPKAYAAYDISYLIAIIMVTFIMGMTLLIVAALFIVRLVALAMIVMFSPIGFVGYIFPATASYADKWWNALFSYSFFAPIMIFIMAISLRMMDAIKNENYVSLVTNANTNAPANQATWIANAALFAIPVITLWMGMGVAKSSGIAMADKVVDNVKKGGKWLAKNPALGMGGLAWRQSGAAGGIKKGWENTRKSGKLFGSEKLAWALKDNKENREARLAGGIEGGKDGWKKAVEKKKLKEFNEKIKDMKDNHAGGEIKDLYKDILNPTGGINSKNAFDVASKFKHIAEDGPRKEEFDRHVRDNVILTDATHIAAMATMSPDDKKDYIKDETAKVWTQARKQFNTAQAEATGKTPTTPPVPGGTP